MGHVTYSMLAAMNDERMLLSFQNYVDHPSYTADIYSTCGKDISFLISVGVWHGTVRYHTVAKLNLLADVTLVRQ